MLRVLEISVSEKVLLVVLGHWLLLQRLESLILTAYLEHGIGEKSNGAQPTLV